MNNLCATVESETVWFWIQKSKTETRRGNKRSLADKTTKDISENRKKNKTNERKKQMHTLYEHVCMCVRSRVFGFIAFTVRITLSRASKPTEFTSRLIVSVSNSMPFFMYSHLIAGSFTFSFVFFVVAVVFINDLTAATVVAIASAAVQHLRKPNAIFWFLFCSPVFVISLKKNYGNRRSGLFDSSLLRLLLLLLLVFNEIE